jgi:hypothetical protein
MKREEFTESRLVITEGFEDCAFVTAITLRRRPALPSMDVVSVDMISEGAGKDGFEEAIIAADGKRGFSRITDVTLVADNDEKAASGAIDSAFNHVRNQLIRAKQSGLQRDWAVPNAPGERAPGEPSVSIWMWPEAETQGCMETLLWRVIEAKYAPLADCIQRASVCMEANAWPIQKRHKAQVRAFLSLYNKRRPTVPFNVLWRDHANIFPIDRGEFSAFVRFLRSI